jgi:hypothetical protein
MDNPSKTIADEYLRLGGHRRAVVDDNVLSIRHWENDTPEADTYWKQNIEPLDSDRREQVISFLPTINAI